MNINSIAGGSCLKNLACLGFLTLLAACGASPAPQFFGATRTEVTKGGINFVVFQKEDHAEVVRLGYLTRAQRAPVQGLMAEAVEEATGCAVRPDWTARRVPRVFEQPRARIFALWGQDGFRSEMRGSPPRTLVVFRREANDRRRGFLP
jgi:hypothetical protein